MTMIRVYALLLSSLCLVLACERSNDDDAARSDLGDKGAASTGGSSEPNESKSGGGPGDAGEGSGGSGGSGSGGAGGSPPTLTGDGGAGGELNFPPDVTFSYDPSKDESPTVCAARSLASQEVLLDMFIILDKSGTMGQGATSEDACPLGIFAKVGSRWCNAILALNGFFEDRSSVGLGFAYSIFASTGCEAFDQMDVPFGVIEADDANGQVQAFRDQLDITNPTGGTFTEGAVRTLIAQTAAHPLGDARKSVAILITDGAPGDCFGVNNDTEPTVELQPVEVVELNGLLSEHYQATGIPTFIVGMTGADGPDLEGLALGAGAERHSDYCLSPDTECSYYSVGDGDPAVFTAALDTIRTLVLGCEYAVPQADVGISKLETLEVKFTKDDVTSPTVLERVADAITCTDSTQYWVDNSSEANAIIKLCPATCDLRTPDSKVDLAIVCEGT